MSVWEAKWSGKYPNFCHGEWTLYRDGEIVNIEIPFQGCCASTYKTYFKWRFDENWNEHWKKYEDGLDFKAWREAYQDFLEELTQDPQEWEKIYLAFQANDWRYCSCGGCI